MIKIEDLKLDQNIKDKISYWLESDVFDHDSKKQIQDLVDSNNTAELVDRFYKDLEFGTGGLRGVMGAGSYRMNIYNVRKATAAVALYLKEYYGEEKKLKVAISYDSRNNSRRFSEVASEVLAAYGIKVLITKHLRPTPMLSFMVRYFECSAGICVTASHNPPEYNGYKLYWSTGGQVVPPYDEATIQKYNSIQKYEDIKTMSYSEGISSGIIEEVEEELDDVYFAEMEKLAIRKNEKKNLKIAFTPLHGTAGYPVVEGLRRFGFTDVSIVEEQKEPDGNFPTVSYPNPEDPKALDLALKLGNKIGADLVLATDPDCDRIGIIYKDHDGSFKFLNGNQIGSVLINYVLSSKKELGVLPDNALVIKTIVTTELQKDICKDYGVSCEDTLTGFKWICQRIQDYESSVLTPYKEYICGGEESYGFLLGSFVRDKDAISACAIAAEMVNHYKLEGKTLTDVLNDCFRKYGIYHEKLCNVVLKGKDGAEKIKKIMEDLRKNPMSSIDGVAVSEMVDVLASKNIVLKEDGKKYLTDIDLPKSNVLQFILKDGTKVSARPSGTEPKIKFYVSVREEIPADTSDDKLEELKIKCEKRAEKICDIFSELSK